jgi:hypothetical protein
LTTTPKRYAPPALRNERYAGLPPRNDHLLALIRDTEAKLEGWKAEYKRRMSELPPALCAACGAAFTPGIDGYTRVRTTNARYCSNACRQRAYRLRTAP